MYIGVSGYHSKQLPVNSASNIQFIYYHFSKSIPLNIYVGEYRNELQARSITQLSAELSI